MAKDNEGACEEEPIKILQARDLAGSDMRAYSRENVDGEPEGYAPSDYVAIFDKRNLDRECLANSLDTHQFGISIFTFSGLVSWQQRKAGLGTLRVALVNIVGRDVVAPQFMDEIAQFVTTLEPVPVVILSGIQTLDHVLQVIDRGVQGFIPNTVDIDVCIKALALAIAGGRFVPASSVLAVRGRLGRYSRERCGHHVFTARQLSVADALRRGKANKLIALELNLCESTVKVYIRSIMKKVGATNRTEAACKVGDIMSDEACEIGRA
ncbi:MULTISPECIES: helix-turn-helix transcriptional regulator [unclassified Shinella]|jgi:DNA-binding NarL/FixJ family response regulator|uniref:helix-turn-helix transcriptional regulator n=1 Tax=unclassified Shinella TaxID=2643062 RepID=UPI001FDFAEDC|nr:MULTISPECIES: response regulator transcription factor [unclassified Shinella]MDG4675906.1 response regulator transcription factor [Shinella sp. 838]